MRWLLVLLASIGIVLAVACATAPVPPPPGPTGNRAPPRLTVDDAGVVHSWRRAYYARDFKFRFPSGVPCGSHPVIWCVFDPDGGVRDCHFEGLADGGDGGEALKALSTGPIVPAELDDLPVETKVPYGFEPYCLPDGGVPPAPDAGGTP